MTTRQSQKNPDHYARAIAASGRTIYDQIEVGDPELWIPTPELEVLLDRALRGVNLHGLPLRTRSKVVKERVCVALGYPVPQSFTKCQPRFPGQAFDTYVQKSNNLQVWNEELSPTRRYVLIRVSDSDVVTRVKVVTGETLALLDTTGTLTQKYQASYLGALNAQELVVRDDTQRMLPLVSSRAVLGTASPTQHPVPGHILPISTIFTRLSSLIGGSIADAGTDQERNRGAALHRAVCQSLGYADYRDDGQFPDVRHQLLEVKLQTSPTVDLGLVLPSSSEPLDVPQIGGVQIRHCDVRYAVFYGSTNGRQVTLTGVVISTGESFFSRFRQFQGKILNKKLQIPLPADFFVK